MVFYYIKKKNRGVGSTTKMSDNDYPPSVLPVTFSEITVVQPNTM